MIKILALLLLLPSLAWAGPEMLLMLTNGAGTVGGSCTTLSIDQDTHAAATTIGNTTAYYWIGIVNDGAADVTMCSVDLYLREYGDLTGKTLSIERWSVNSSTYYLDTKLEDVATFNASTPTTSLAYHNVPFGKTITLGQYQALVLTLNVAPDAVNYLGSAMTTSSQGSAGNLFFATWTQSTKVSYINSKNNDLRFKAYQ